MDAGNADQGECNRAPPTTDRVADEAGEAEASAVGLGAICYLKDPAI